MAHKSWSKPGGWPSEGSLCRTGSRTAQRRSGCSSCALGGRRFLCTPSPSPPRSALHLPLWSPCCPGLWLLWTWKFHQVQSHHLVLSQRFLRMGTGVHRRQTLFHRPQSLSGRPRCRESWWTHWSSTYHTRWVLSARLPSLAPAFSPPSTPPEACFGARSKLSPSKKNRPYSSSLYSWHFDGGRAFWRFEFKAKCENVSDRVMFKLSNIWVALSKSPSVRSRTAAHRWASLVKTKSPL